MQAFKFNFLQKIFLSITALMFLSCGSFSPSSFVSSDGLYQSQEVVSESNNGEFYKNYFRELTGLMRKPEPRFMYGGVV